MLRMHLATVILVSGLCVVSGCSTTPTGNGSFLSRFRATSRTTPVEVVDSPVTTAGPPLSEPPPTVYPTPISAPSNGTVVPIPTMPPPQRMGTYPQQAPVQPYRP